jgi:glucuronide carrier protein
MLAFVVAPQIQGSSDLQRSLTLTTLAFVVVGMALYLFLFKTAREVVQRDVAHVSLRQSLGTLKRNRPLLMLCLSALAFLTAMFSLQTVQAFYARDVLGNANYFIVLTLVSTGAMFVVAPFIPKTVRVFGKKKAYIGAGALSILGAVGISLAPPSLPLVAIAFFTVYGVGLAAVNILMFALEADTVEYGEWRTGVRTEGTTYAAFSFTRKLGQAVGGAVAAYAIGLGGYVAGADVQSEGAINAIRYAAGFVPAVFILIAITIMAKYPLTESRFQAMVSEVAERRTAAGTGARQDTEA